MAGTEGELRYAPHRDRHLAFRTWGEGPPLLYVPSQWIPISEMTDEPEYERFLQGLASFATVIAFDRLGVGQSDPMDGPPTVDDWVDQMESVLAGAGVDSAHVLANGISGAAAVVLAERAPDRVRSLVLAMAAVGFRLPDDFDMTPIRGSAVPGATGDVVDFLALLVPSRAGDPRFRQWWDRAGRRGAAPAVAQALLEMQSRVDALEASRRVTVPTLVLRRGRPAGFSQGVEAEVPDSLVVQLEGRDVLAFVDSDAVVTEIEAFLTGQRRAAPTVRPMLTLMFTDVVGSTSAAAELGDRRWRDLLEEHDRLLRHTVERHGGTAVDTAGDAFVSTFPAPTAALRCAARLHREMEDLGLQLRVGIHCGEIEVRDRNIAGIAVHLAARVEALADPGTTFVSSTVREATLGSGHTFEPRGEHQLKGVPGVWSLWAAGPVA